MERKAPPVDRYSAVGINVAPNNAADQDPPSETHSETGTAALKSPQAQLVSPREGKASSQTDSFVHAALVLIIALLIVLLGLSAYTVDRHRAQEDTDGWALSGAASWQTSGSIPDSQKLVAPDTEGCGQGKYFDTATTMCKNCPAGCLACTKPSASQPLSTGVCRPCAASFWWDATTVSCKSCTTACPNGRFIKAPCSAFSDTLCQPTGLGLPGFADDARWDDIVALARGSTLNWWQWQGDEHINGWVDTYVKSNLQTKFNITLVKGDHTFAAKVIQETAAGWTRNGSVDMMWINGDNYHVMRGQNLLYLDWPQLLPNSVFYDFEDHGTAYDFGAYAADAEFPYNVAQVIMVYDSVRTPEPPQTVAEFVTRVKANPGRWTYSSPASDFTGSAMIRHFFYEFSGPYTDYSGTYATNPALFDSRVNATWEVLDAIAPYLYKSPTHTGQPYYPAAQSTVDDLFAQGLIDFTINYDPAFVANNIANNRFPSTTRALVFETGTIGNTNYLGIPANAAHKAAALVAINFIGSFEACLSRAQPENWGAMQALDHDSIPPSWSALLDEAFPDETVGPEELSDHRLGELDSSYVVKLQNDWATRIGAHGSSV